MRDALVCPECRGSLRWGDSSIRCAVCHAEYAFVRGVAVLTPRDDDSAHNRLQAQFFDAVDAEFEIARPHNATRLYRCLIDDKFRRSVAAIDGVVAGGTALTVCGGSGMDAEFLARAGARVALADISLGAAERALERARRARVELTAVVGDAERLPFADRSVDLVYVHDGLHHLERPLHGLAEMARVARRAVSVNEPARAAATAIAVRLGLSEVAEEAGNVVERLDPRSVARELERHGLDVVHVERYAMVYRHEPGRVSRLLSTSPVFPFVWRALTAFNGLAGGIGNKFTVQALRR